MSEEEADGLDGREWAFSPQGFVGRVQAGRSMFTERDHLGFPSKMSHGRDMYAAERSGRRREEP